MKEGRKERKIKGKKKENMWNHLFLLFVESVGDI